MRASTHRSLRPRGHGVIILFAVAVDALSRSDR
jgi:hypothetical protein